MKKNILSTNEATQLRENAKEVLELRKRANPNDLSKLPLNNILETVHELQVHQIELEMQNEELRALHLEIETARTRYFELYDLAPVGYCTLSDRGIILEANLTAATLLGVNRGALFQRPMSRYIWIEDQDLYFHQIKALLQTKKQQTFQIRFKKSDESLFYAHLVLSLDIHNGEVKQIKLTMSDCSEIKRLEEQLQQSQKMELIGRLAGGVAHDFNNMLAVILGNVERSLSSLTVSDPTYQSMIEIQEAAERSVLMTRQLLGFARKQMIQPQILNINTQIEKTISILKRLVGENIEITTEFEEGLGSIQIDCSQLDQILTNLCVNARDAIVGQGKIHLSTQKKYLEDKSAFEGCIPGFYVCLSIKDNGSGIDPSVQKRLSGIYKSYAR